VEDLLRLVPRIEGRSLVAPEQQHQLVVGRARVQLPQRVDHEGRPLAVHLEPRRGKTLVPSHSQLHHLIARLRPGILLDLAVRRHAGRNPQDRVELQLDDRLLRADQMAYVWRIERPAEDANASGRYYNLT